MLCSLSKDANHSKQKQTNKQTKTFQQNYTSRGRESDFYKLIFH